MGFSRQEYWSGLLFPSPEDLPNPELEPGSYNMVTTVKMRMHILKLLREDILIVLITIKILQLYMVMNINWIYHGHHFTTYIKISNPYIVHLKLIQCYMSIVSQ